MGDDRVSRMAAVLVQAAGGRIRVPLSLIRDAQFIRLHQSDAEPGFVTYSTTPFDRAAGGAIIDNSAPATVDHMKRIGDASR